jgi:hypothetical protein
MDILGDSEEKLCDSVNLGSDAKIHFPGGSNQQATTPFHGLVGQQFDVLDIHQSGSDIRKHCAHTLQIDRMQPNGHPATIRSQGNRFAQRTAGHLDIHRDFPTDHLFGNSKSQAQQIPLGLLQQGSASGRKVPDKRLEGRADRSRPRHDLGKPCITTRFAPLQGPGLQPLPVPGFPAFPLRPLANLHGFGRGRCG